MGIIDINCRRFNCLFNYDDLLYQLYELFLFSHFSEAVAGGVLKVFRPHAGFPTGVENMEGALQNLMGRA